MGGFFLCAIALTTAPALAQRPCDPARLDTDPTTLPASWQHALTDLVDATAHEGLPWSCQGGHVSLDLDADGAATLTVIDATGHARARHIATPEDLVPMAEALLSKPLPPPAAPPPEKPARDQLTPAPTTPAEPRLLVDALIGPRFAGKTNILWGSIALRAMVPFGPWSGGAWARIDNLPAELGEDRHVELPTDLSLGISVGRRLLAAPIELSATFDPSVAVVSRNGHKHEAGTTHVNGRLGLSLRASMKVARPLRVLAAIDGEFAPAELDDHEDSSTVLAPGEHPPAPFPAYTLGLSLGAELVLR